MANPNRGQLVTGIRSATKGRSVSTMVWISDETPYTSFVPSEDPGQTNWITLLLPPSDVNIVVVDAWFQVTEAFAMASGTPKIAIGDRALGINTDEAYVKWTAANATGLKGLAAAEKGARLSSRTTPVIGGASGAVGSSVIGLIDVSTGHDVSELTAGKVKFYLRIVEF